MKYAADLVDVSFEDISGALRKLKPKITENNEALQKLGVSTKNADGSTRNATDVFYAAVKALSQISNETERDQLAMELFGKSADELAGIIDDGGEALRQYGEEAESLGAVMSGETIDSLNEINDTIDSIKAQGGAALAQLGATFAKAFAPAIKKVIPLINKVKDAISKLTPEQAELILKIAGVAAAIAPVLIIGGKLISGIGSVISIIGTVVGVLGGPLTIAIGAAIAAGVLLYKNWDKVKEYAIKVKDAVVAAWDSIKEWTVNAWNNIKNAVTNTFSSIKTAVTDKMNVIKTSVSAAWDNIKTNIKEKGLAGAAADAFGNIKDIIGEKMDGAISKVKSKVAELKSYFNFSSLGNAFNAVKSSIDGFISKMINLAKTVYNKIQEIKSYFKFSWSLPHIKIPHFRVKGGKWPYGLGGEGYLPSIKVDWYKRAYDNPIIFTQPTVMATNQGYKGFGDGTGAEIVMGLNKLRELVGASQPVVINVYGTAGQNVNELAYAVQQRLVTMQKQREAAYA